MDLFGSEWEPKKVVCNQGWFKTVWYSLFDTTILNISELESKNEEECAFTMLLQVLLTKFQSKS